MATVAHLDFEKAIAEVEEQIDRLQDLARERGLDVSAELRSLERKLQALKRDVYQNLSPIERVQVARHPRRPYTLDYLELVFTDFVELHGDRFFADDPAVVAGLARFRGTPCAVVGHQKGKGTKENLARNFGMPNPEGFRKAGRVMRMATRFRLPIVTFVDTPGAYPGIEAEERGQFEAIASNIALMSELGVPILTVVIGEGGSGGALGIAMADRVLILENSVYSVISPEGCATILWRDASKAEQAASALGLTSDVLLRLGLVDEILPEPLGGAHRDLGLTFETVGSALERQLDGLRGVPAPALLESRYQKYRRMAVYTESAS